MKVEVTNYWVEVIGNQSTLTKAHLTRTTVEVLGAISAAAIDRNQVHHILCEVMGDMTSTFSKTHLTRMNVEVLGQATGI